MRLGFPNLRVRSTNLHVLLQFLIFSSNSLWTKIPGLFLPWINQTFLKMSAYLVSTSIFSSDCLLILPVLRIKAKSLNTNAHSEARQLSMSPTRYSEVCVLFFILHSAWLPEDLNLSSLWETLRLSLSCANAVPVRVIVQCCPRQGHCPVLSSVIRI